MTSGVQLEASFYRDHVQERQKLFVPQERSFPIPLKHIVVRRTHTAMDANEYQMDDYSNVHGDRRLSRQWTVTSCIFEKSHFRELLVVQGEIDKDSSNVQA